MTILTLSKTVLMDVLEETPTAADALVRELMQDSSLQNARLTCRSLRAFIDVNVKEVKLIVAPHAAQPLSLLRWPSCESLTLTLNLKLTERMESMSDILDRAIQPFRTLPLANRRRITTLILRKGTDVVPVDWTADHSWLPAEYHPHDLQAPADASTPPPADDPADTDWGTEAAVIKLVTCLPNIRYLDLVGVWNMSYDQQDQQDMFTALASLPHLETLLLPGVEALSGLSALVGSPIRRLVVSSAETELGFYPLTPLAVAGISHLRNLEVLELHEGASVALLPDSVLHAGGMPSISLMALLDALPASLRVLRLKLDADRQSYVIELNYLHTVAADNNTMTSRMASGNSIPTGKLATVRTYQELNLHHLSALTEQLIGSRPMGRSDFRLQLFEVGGIKVSKGASLSPVVLASLRTLASRSSRVAVGRLTASAADTHKLIDILGMPPEMVVEALRIRLRDGEGRRGPSAWHPVNQPAPHALGNARWSPYPTIPSGAALAAMRVPSAEILAHRVLQRLTGRLSSAGLAGRQNAHEGAGEAAGYSPYGPRRTGASGPCDLLLLWGSHIASLVAAPARLQAWLSMLVHHISGDGTADSHDAVVSASGAMSYKVLPAPTCAVVLACNRSPGAAASVAAAALASVVGQAEGVLNVAPVVEKKVATNRGRWWRVVSAEELYLDAVQQELQAIWDARPRGSDLSLVPGPGSGAMMAERELMKQMLDRAGQLGGTALMRAPGRRAVVDSFGWGWEVFSSLTGSW